MGSRVVHDDVLAFCKHYNGPKFHALLCDPPYHLTSPTNKGHRAGSLGLAGFMGKEWDGGNIAYRPETWAALAEHLLPGAFGMAFASSRGWHRLACAIEDAGLIIHPSIFGWCYGSGFPKATRIDTQVDKAAGAKRKVIGKIQRGDVRDAKSRGVGYLSDPANKNNESQFGYGCEIKTAPATDLARAWAGHRYGLQALKPALEPIIVFQKPYRGKPVECITETGAGALNIDGARIGTQDNLNGGAYSGGVRPNSAMGCEGEVGGTSSIFEAGTKRMEADEFQQPQGRWPANFYIQHSPLCVYKGTKRVKGRRDETPAEDEGRRNKGQWRFRPTPATSRGYADPDGKETVADWECVEECPVFRLGRQSGGLKSGSKHGEYRGWGHGRDIYGDSPSYRQDSDPDSGTAARFFLNVDWQLEQVDPVLYSAKASRGEREEGLRGQILCLRCDCLDSEHHIVHTEGKTTTVYPLERVGHGDIPSLEEIQVHKKEKDYPWKLAKCTRNPHPTVKPLKLTQWLATLLLPPKEYAPRRILVPFAGSGSEMIGAALVGWEEAVGIEKEEEYCEIAEARIEHWTKNPQLHL